MIFYWFFSFLATFDRKDGSKVSFKDYYKERYNIDVRELTQPLLISMPKDKDKRRGDLQAVKIIPELTQMTGFTDQQRQNYKMMNVRNWFIFLVSISLVHATKDENLLIETFDDIFSKKVWTTNVDKYGLFKACFN